MSFRALAGGMALSRRMRGKGWILFDRKQGGFRDTNHLILNMTGHKSELAAIFGRT